MEVEEVQEVEKTETNSRQMDTEETEDDTRLRRNTYRVAVLIRKTAVKVLDQVGEKDTGPVYQVKVDRIQDRNLNDIRHLFVKVDLGLLDQILTTSRFSLWVRDETANTNTRRLDHTPDEEAVVTVDSVLHRLLTGFGGWNIWQETVKGRKRVDWREDRKKFKRVVTRVARSQEGGRCFRAWY